MTELLVAVDALTVQQRFKQLQGTSLVTVVLPPLLTQLDAAIRSSLGGSAAGVSLPSEVSVANNAALFVLVRIGSQVSDWGRAVGSEVVRGDTSGNLRRWYVKTLESEFNPAFHVRTLRSWAAEIRVLLDPPRQFDLPDTCPADDCGADRWWRNQLEGGLRPLTVVYRPGEPVGQARASCRACGASWNVRELSFLLEQRAKNESADSGTDAS